MKNQEDLNIIYVYFFRCSPAFFDEERNALETRRNKIRLLQQRKLSELSNFKDLPNEIPMHLVIGTKVTGKILVYFICFVFFSFVGFFSSF